MTKKEARKLKKKCIRLAEKFVSEENTYILADCIFRLVRQETK